MELIGLIAPTCENSAVKKPKGKTNFYTRWITLLRKTVATCSKDQIISYSHEKGGGVGGAWGIQSLQCFVHNFSNEVPQL